MDGVRSAAERAVSERCGTTVRFGPDPEIIRAMGDGYATVARFRILGGIDAASVVVKRPGNWAAYDPDRTDGTAWGLLNEWAGVELLNEADASIAPKLLGADRVHGLLVFEDLGPGDGVADLLLGQDASSARDGLMGLAGVLGRMHATTAGRAGEYDRIRRELGPLPEQDRHYAMDRFVPAFGRAIEMVGLTLPGGARDDAEGAITAMREPGAFSAYTHGDPCPDNTRVVGDRVVLIDFEVGGFRHALLDGTYGRVPFPTCWCVNRIPDDVVADMDEAYIAEIAEGVPGARDAGSLVDAMLNAMAFWAIASTGWHVPRALEADEPMHRAIHTRRQGLTLRWETFIGASESHGRLRELAAFGREILGRLAALWPDTEPMPLYPAFR